jgi:hypothetical protein
MWVIVETRHDDDYKHCSAPATARVLPRGFATQEEAMARVHAKYLEEIRDAMKDGERFDQAWRKLHGAKSEVPEEAEDVPEDDVEELADVLLAAHYFEGSTVEWTIFEVTTRPAASP